jgi:preprotein translocase subunit YajC
MNFLISEALAADGAPAAQQGGSMMSILFLVLMFGAFYFLLIRPQQKRAKEHKTMIASLSKGDEVVTAGGVLGRISDISENYVSVEIADGVNIKVQRQAVQTVLPKGTIKTTG